MAGNSKARASNGCGCPLHVQFAGGRRLRTSSKMNDLPAELSEIRGCIWPRRHCWSASPSFIVSAWWPQTSAILEGSVWRGRIYAAFWPHWKFRMTPRAALTGPVDYCNYCLTGWMLINASRLWSGIATRMRRGDSRIAHDIKNKII